MARRKINQAIDETNGLLRIQVRPFKLNRDAFSQRAIKQRVLTEPRNKSWHICLVHEIAEPYVTNLANSPRYWLRFVP